MKDIIQENIAVLYKEYCQYIENLGLEFDYADSNHYKQSFTLFMEWIDKGYLTVNK